MSGTEADSIAIQTGGKTPFVVEKRDASGRFLPGIVPHPGPGRPPRRDLRAIAEERAERKGLDIDGGLFDVFETLLQQAKDGDTQAAKLLLDHMVEKAPTEVTVHAGEMTTESVERRAEQLLEVARRRMAAAQGDTNGHPV